MTASRFNFRAYINSLNKIYRVYNLMENGDKIEVIDNYGDFVGDGDGFYKNEFVLMQSTGFVDKNGKEIFEGDVVNILNFSNEKDRMRTIEFYDGGFKAISIWGEDYKDKSKVDIFGTCPSTSGVWNIEVIGNIYENKDTVVFEKC